MKDESTNRLTFSLPHFEGPLELLLYLIQKQEVDIFDIVLKELTTQFLKEQNHENNLTLGAEFLWYTSKLLLMKSQRLLPSEYSLEEPEEEDFRFAMMKRLCEYARFKEVAKILLNLEQREQSAFARDPLPFAKKPDLGLEEVELKDLSERLHKLIEQAKSHKTEISIAQKWEVSPKIEWFKTQLHVNERLIFEDVFSPHKCKEELIVTFLALLEIMKLQVASLIREEAIFIIARKSV